MQHEVIERYHMRDGRVVEEGVILAPAIYERLRRFIKKGKLNIQQTNERVPCYGNHCSGTYYFAHPDGSKFYSNCGPTK